MLYHIGELNNNSSTLLLRRVTRREGKWFTTYTLPSVKGRAGRRNSMKITAETKEQKVILLLSIAKGGRQLPGRC